MANSKIRGITIEIGGDTTKLDKALGSVDKKVKGTQVELREVNKLLKIDPTNTEMLAQKQPGYGKRRKRRRWVCSECEHHKPQGIKSV